MRSRDSHAEGSENGARGQHHHQNGPHHNQPAKPFPAEEVVAHLFADVRRMKLDFIHTSDTNDDSPHPWMLCPCSRTRGAAESPISVAR